MDLRWALDDLEFRFGSALRDTRLAVAAPDIAVDTAIGTAVDTAVDTGPSAGTALAWDTCKPKISSVNSSV